MQEKGALQLAEEPGRMQEQESSCKQGCPGSLGPYGCRPGPSIGLPAGEDGPKAAPNRKKSLGMQGRAPHLYTPKLMMQEAMMMRTPPTSATMLKSLATRPRRRAPSTSPCCRLFRDMTA